MCPGCMCVCPGCVSRVGGCVSVSRVCVCVSSQVIGDRLACVFKSYHIQHVHSDLVNTSTSMMRSQLKAVAS